MEKINKKPTKNWQTEQPETLLKFWFDGTKANVKSPSFKLDLLSESMWIRQKRSARTGDRQGCRLRVISDIVSSVFCLFLRYHWLFFRLNKTYTHFKHNINAKNKTNTINLLLWGNTILRVFILIIQNLFNSSPFSVLLPPLLVIILANCYKNNFQKNCNVLIIFNL